MLSCLISVNFYSLLSYQRYNPDICHQVIGLYCNVKEYAYIQNIFILTILFFCKILVFNIKIRPELQNNEIPAMFLPRTTSLYKTSCNQCSSACSSSSSLENQLAVDSASTSVLK